MTTESQTHPVGFNVKINSATQTQTDGSVKFYPSLLNDIPSYDGNQEQLSEDIFSQFWQRVTLLHILINYYIQLQEIGEDACKKWKSLRNRYARELEKLSDLNGTGTESQQLEVQTWDLSENLSFLQNHIEHNKRTVTNYTPNKVSLAQTSDKTSCAESTSSNPSICVEEE
ncbi:hypothetical protein FQA39_LY11128 [Lamprigera yunnana]|nr:hypothetical protein FQA39_LY11128 [Lamprigera yunnana]